MQSMAEVKSAGSVGPLAKGPTYHFNVIYNYARCPLSTTADTQLSLAWTQRAVEVLQLQGLDSGYYHDRDCPRGQGLAQELARVIAGSQVTLVLLSPGFVRDCWPRYWLLSPFRSLFNQHTTTSTSSPATLLPPSETSPGRPSTPGRGGVVVPVALGLDTADLPHVLKDREVLYFPKDWQQRDDCWASLTSVFAPPPPAVTAEERIRTIRVRSQETPPRTVPSAVSSDVCRPGSDLAMDSSDVCRPGSDLAMDSSDVCRPGSDLAMDNTRTDRAGGDSGRKEVTDIDLCPDAHDGVTGTLTTDDTDCKLSAGIPKKRTRDLDPEKRRVEERELVMTHSCEAEVESAVLSRLSHAGMRRDSLQDDSVTRLAALGHAASVDTIHITEASPSSARVDVVWQEAQTHRWGRHARNEVSQDFTDTKMTSEEKWRKSGKFSPRSEERKIMEVSSEFIVYSSQSTERDCLFSGIHPLPWDVSQSTPVAVHSGTPVHGSRMTHTQEGDSGVTEHHSDNLRAAPVGRAVVHPSDTEASVSSTHGPPAAGTLPISGNMSPNSRNKQRPLTVLSGTVSHRDDHDQGGDQFSFLALDTTRADESETTYENCYVTSIADGSDLSWSYISSSWTASDCGSSSPPHDLSAVSQDSGFLSSSHEFTEETSILSGHKVQHSEMFGDLCVASKDRIVDNMTLNTSDSHLEHDDHLQNRNTTKFNEGPAFDSGPAKSASLCQEKDSSRVSQSRGSPRIKGRCSQGCDQSAGLTGESDVPDSRLPSPTVLKPPPHPTTSVNSRRQAATADSVLAESAVQRTSKRLSQADVGRVTARKDSWIYIDVDKDWSVLHVLLPLCRVLCYALTRPDLPYF